jgi:hypothetical protein
VDFKVSCFFRPHLYSSTWRELEVPRPGGSEALFGTYCAPFCAPLDSYNFVLSAPRWDYLASTPQLHAPATRLANLPGEGVQGGTLNGSGLVAQLSTAPTRLPNSRPASENV